jgi:hypothetical protein
MKKGRREVMAMTDQEKQALVDLEEFRDRHAGCGDGVSHAHLVVTGHQTYRVTCAGCEDTMFLWGGTDAVIASYMLRQDGLRVEKRGP